jgi:hypothetical protein
MALLEHHIMGSISDLNASTFLRPLVAASATSPPKLPEAGKALAYTIPNAAKVSGISRSGLYKLFRARTLTPRSAGGRTLVMADELQEYVRSLPPAPIRRTST